MLPAPRLFPCVQGCEDRGCRIHARHDVRNCHTDLLWATTLFVCRSCDAHKPAGCLDHGIVPGLRCAAARLPERRNRTDDQARVRRQQIIRVKLVALECSNFEVLEQDIRLARELTNYLLATSRRDVRGQRTLVAVCAQKIGRLTPQPGWAPLPRIVAVPGTLHLDHISTVVTQQLAGPWTSKNPAHIEYAQFIQSGCHASYRVQKKPGQPYSGSR